MLFNFIGKIFFWILGVVYFCISFFIDLLMVLSFFGTIIAFFTFNPPTFIANLIALIILGIFKVGLLSIVCLVKEGVNA